MAALCLQNPVCTQLILTDPCYQKLNYARRSKGNRKLSQAAHHPHKERQQQANTVPMQISVEWAE